MTPVNKFCNKYMHIIYSEQETSEIYLADIPSNTLVASWVSSSVPQLGAAMLDDDEKFLVGVEAEATRVEGFFFFGPGFFLAAFAKPVVGILGFGGAFGIGGIIAARGGATAHGALGPSWGAVPMEGMPVGDMAGDPSMEGMPMGGATSHPSMGSMPVAATWERLAQRTAPAAPAVDAMGGGGPQ